MEADQTNVDPNLRLDCASPGTQDVRVVPLDMDKAHKVVMVCVGTTCFISLMLFADRMTFIRLIVWLLSLLCTLFFGSWCYLMWTAPSLFRVQVRHTRIPDWMPQAVPQSRKLYRDVPVYSVSEIASVRGTHLHTMMHVFSALIMMTSFICIAVLHQDLPFVRLRDEVDKEEVIVLFGGLTMFGFPMLSIFEMSPFDRMFRFLHYVGVLLMLLGIWAFPVATDWSAGSLCWVSAEYFITIMWWVSCTLPGRGSGVEQVSRTSKICVWAELLMFLVNAIIVILTINEFDH